MRDLWAAAWLTWAGLFFALEIIGLRTPDRVGTASHQLSRLARTHTRRGRFIFAITVTAGTGWLVAHILNPIGRD